MAEIWLCATPIASAISDCFESKPRSSRIRRPTAFQSITIFSWDLRIDIISQIGYSICMQMLLRVQLFGSLTLTILHQPQLSTRQKKKKLMRLNATWTSDQGVSIEI